jgi:hypothetical protein
VFAETVTVAATAIEHRRAIRDVVSGLWNRMTKRRVRIVVFGAAGTGKSSLGRLLSGADVSPEYSESTQIETYRLDGATGCTVLVPPGQDSLRAATWNDLVRDVASGKATVVVHVVSWGINAIEPLPFRGVAGFQEGMSPEDAAEAFAANQRARELETLREYASHFGLAPSKLSLLTVVTKQDLWWDRREEVRRHYEGEYAQVVDGLRRRVGDKNLSHKLWSVSLIAKNLRDGEGQMIVPTARGYDDPLRTANAKRLVEIVEQEVEHAR